MGPSDRPASASAVRWVSGRPSREHERTDPMKLDLGCGTAKREGFIGVDARAFPGVDRVIDLTSGVDSLTGRALIEWPWDCESVDEVWCSHFVEHLTPFERIHFANELHRILKPEGHATIITPHWCSQRAYGDLTHQWPPVSEFWYLYLEKAWRAVNASHNDGYSCDFEHTLRYGVSEELVTMAAKDPKGANTALAWYRDAPSDLVAVLRKVKP